jgi:hypothetical protein
MAEIATNFPPQTYSSSFFLNSLTDEEKSAVGDGNEAATKRTDNAPLLDCFISTMSRSLLFLTCAVFILHLHPTQATECVIPHEPKTRVFDTLVQYQANTVPFAFGKVGWQGSNVEIENLTTKKLEKNLFVTDDSSSIIALKLSDKGVVQVDDGAFYNLICLHELVLDRNNITALTKGVFDDLLKLEKLDLSDNQLKVLKSRVFGSLHNLKSLDLGKNRIKTIEGQAFVNLTSLEYLNLESNLIAEISPDVLRPLTSLQVLILDRNQLPTVQVEQWNGLDKLLNLSLTNNRLNGFYSGYNFSFPSLKSLNVSGNTLSGVNIYSMKKHMPRLELIDFNGNPMLCDELQVTIGFLNQSGVKFVPGNNHSSASIQGIACKAHVPMARPPIMTKVLDVVDKQYLEQYVDKKIRDKMDDVHSSMVSLQIVVVIVFVVVVLFLIFQVLTRTNWCRAAMQDIRVGDEPHIDNEDPENLTLLGR